MIELATDFARIFLMIPASSSVGLSARMITVTDAGRASPDNPENFIHQQISLDLS
jgi:hypothetical protein